MAFVQLTDKDGSNVEPLGGKRATKYATNEIPDGSVMSVAPNAVVPGKLIGTEFRETLFTGPFTHSSGNGYLTKGISEFAWLEIYCHDDQGHYWVQEVYAPGGGTPQVVFHVDLNHMWQYSSSRVYWEAERLTIDTRSNDTTNPPYFFMGGFAGRLRIDNNSNFQMQSGAYYTTIEKIVGVRVG